MRCRAGRRRLGRRRLWIALALGASVGPAGCTDALLGPEPADDPVAIFDLVWQEFDRHYAYFVEKEIDWNALRDTYRPRVTPTTTGDELFDVLSDMLDHLEDGHVNLWTPTGGYGWDWFGGAQENFDQGIAFAQLDRGATWAADRHLAHGRVGDIGYIHIPTFEPGAWAAEIDGVLASLEGVRALIIDLRGNGGGSDTASEEILSRFIEEETIYRWFRYRNGPGHGDFTPLRADRISPRGRLFEGPVAVLTNRRNFSTAEDFVAGMKSFGRVWTVGDTTGGGRGNPIHRELPNGWTFRLSRWQLFSADRRPMPDGVGLVPDVAVSISEEDAANGRDTILLTAIRVLRESLASGG